MKTIRSGLFLFLLCVLAFAWFTWPLPRYFMEGIPSGTGGQEVRAMIPGDHLQLLYHFNLVDSMLHGDLPWFYNIYEFYTGDDASRYKAGAYYFPFSFVFSGFKNFFSQAAAWNLTLYLSVFLGAWFMWLLLRRYSTYFLPVFLGLALHLSLFFRWETLLGGSPTGFTLMTVPLLFLGLDIWIREQKFTGSFLAGLGILLASLVDPHVFFFGVLASPFFILLALIFREESSSSWGNFIGRTLLTSVPLIVLSGSGLAYRLLRNSRFHTTTVSGGRSMREVALFSPEMDGFFSQDTLGISNFIFIGWGIVAVAATGLLVFLIRALKETRKQRMQFAGYLFLIACILGIMGLALGPHGPKGGKLFILARSWISPYAMIRQPAKIFCLLTVFLPMIGTLAGAALYKIPWLKSSFAGLVCITLAGGVALEHKAHVQTTVSLLDSHQAAYAKVYEDAQEEGRKAQALALPLWPGDSAWSSIYQHYGALHGIRMVNGYSPIVEKSYISEVFRFLETANKGMFNDEQLDWLKRIGVRHILFHENAFPEKVSPFPAGFTLQNLVKHPRLSMNLQDGPVILFEIDSSGDKLTFYPARDDMPWFPTRRYEVEKYEPQGEILDDVTASRGRCVLLNETDQFVQTRKVHVTPSDQLRFWIRYQGKGMIQPRLWKDEDSWDQPGIEVDAAEWSWLDIPVTELDASGRIKLQVILKQGQVQIDQMNLAGGLWPMPREGDFTFLPAWIFFHAGYTDLDSGHVVLEPRRVHADPDGVDPALYGPRMPLPPGRYRYRLHLESEAGPGTWLGDIRFFTGNKELLTFPLLVGESTEGEFVIPDNQTFNMNLAFSGQVRLQFKGLLLERLAASTGQAHESS